MSCYCANYYGSINCQNRVRQFGDRCALCVTVSLQPADSKTVIHIKSVNEQWYENSMREQLRREEEKSRRERLLRVIE